MSLKGHLEVFPLEEVLRLLARSKKSGCLRVESAAHSGRIFMAGGTLSYATVNDDDYLRRQVVNSGLVSAAALQRADRSALPELLEEGVKASALSDFIREEVVESLYRIRKAGTGAFEFHVDMLGMYPTGQSFDADVAVSEADRRALDWVEIEKVLPDLASPLRMTYELPDENDATLTPGAWKVLARLEAGHSIDDLSAALGMSRFRAAREISEQMRAGRVEYVPAPVAEPVYEPEQPVFSAPSWDSPQAEVAEVAELEVEAPQVWAPEEESPERETPGEAAEQWGEPSWSYNGGEEPEQAEPAVFEVPEGHEVAATDETAEAPAAEAPAEAPAAEAPAETPAAEAPAETPAAEAPAEAPAAEADTGQDAQEETTGGWWAQAMDEPAKEDADAFLESVFGELDETETETPEEEQGFGVGLLRRRRMGAVARDLTEGSDG